MLTLTQSKRKEFRDFRETLECLNLNEETYSYMVETGKTIIAQMAEAMEKSNLVMKTRYPCLGNLFEQISAPCIAKYEYMFRLLSGYFDEETDNAEQFNNDRMALLRCLRHDIFVSK